MSARGIDVIILNGRKTVTKTIDHRKTFCRNRPGSTTMTKKRKLLSTKIKRLVIAPEERVPLNSPKRVAQVFSCPRDDPCSVLY